MEDLSETWRQSFHACLELAQTLHADDWDQPTGCPRWTVRDIYVHLAEGEAAALGDPQPLPRPATPAALVSRLLELAQRHAARHGQFARQGRSARSEAGTQPAAFDAEAVRRLLTLRALDCWVHEQDIRIAVGRPGNLDSPGGRLVHRMFRESLPYSVGMRAGLPNGTLVRFIVDGPLEFDTDILVEDRRGRQLAAVDRNATPTTLVATDWLTFVQLCAGRTLPADAPVRLGGDVRLAHQVTAALAVTP
jgi:uncharacterized protein (TIGR03083 family)